VRHARPLAVGLNCALGAALMRPYIEELSKVAADTYISCYPNAGLPNPMSETGFDETPEVTGALMEEFARSGFLNIAGGCCGTTPEHIAEIARLARKVGTRPRASGDGLAFRARFSSLSSGEFTDAERVHFVVEPPDPPLPEPDMDEIRRQANPAEPGPWTAWLTPPPPHERVAWSTAWSLDSVEGVQQAVLEGLRRGACFRSSHKEGGSTLRWRLGQYVREDYGDEPGHQAWSDEAEFLAMLRRYLHGEVQRDLSRDPVPFAAHDRHRLRHLDAVNRGRHDAAGIARAFAGRVQAARVQALAVAPAGCAAATRCGSRRR
jgi:hypothetical protein